eukprot:3622994-Amphidinium_carterae.1
MLTNKAKHARTVMHAQEHAEAKYFQKIGDLFVTNSVTTVCNNVRGRIRTQSTTPADGLYGVLKVSRRQCVLRPASAKYAKG